MATSQNVQAWLKQTAATSPQGDTDAPWTEGQDPATVNNYARSNMSAIKKFAEDTGGGLAAGGTANALTVTTNQVLSAGHLVAGLRLEVRATADNTSATVTFAPDGLTAANIKRADGSALAIGSIKSGMMLQLYYNAGSSEWRCANIAPATGASSSAIVLLTSGSASGATLDLVLTGYTGYRGLKFVLSGWLPNADGAKLIMRVSTNGGSTYDATLYSTAIRLAADNGNHSYYSQAGTDTGWVVAGILPGAAEGSVTAGGIGNGITEGADVEVTLLGQTSTSRWPKATWIGYFIDSEATPTGVSFRGGGAREAAQDTDAVRFLFDSGNIAAGEYAIYGLA